MVSCQYNKPRNTDYSTTDNGPLTTDYHIPAGRLLISLATYNERDNVAPLAEAIHAVAPQADILVIDDGSPDGTGPLVEEMAKKDPRVRLMQRGKKLGLGTATLAAMRYAIDNGYDFLLNVDADFSHPPRYIPALLAGMNNHDVMIGSRYIAGGGTENWPLSRRMISKSVNAFVRTIFWMPVRDASGAFRCYRVGLLKRAQLERVKSRGYSFQQEVLFRCHKAGANRRTSDHLRESQSRHIKSESEGKRALDRDAHLARHARRCRARTLGEPGRVSARCFNSSHLG